MFAIVIISLMQCYIARKIFEFSRSFIVVLTIVVQSGIAETSRRKYVIIMLWMLCSIVLVTFYTGGMTSYVIKPPPDDVITSWENLEKSNLTLIFFQKFQKDINSNVLNSLLKAGINVKNANIPKRLVDKSVLHEDICNMVF